MVGIWAAIKIWIWNLLGRYELFKIDEGLYQSGKIGLWGLRRLKKEGINVVVDLQGGFDLELYAGKFEVYLLWPIKDEPKLPPLLMLHNLALMVNLLTETGSKVLVHCAAGFNRSGLLNGVILYYRGYYGQLILDKLKAGRPGSCYNKTFENYLLGLQERTGKP